MWGPAPDIHTVQMLLAHPTLRSSLALPMHNPGHTAPSPAKSLPKNGRGSCLLTCGDVEPKPGPGAHSTHSSPPPHLTVGNPLRWSRLPIAKPWHRTESTFSPSAVRPHCSRRVYCGWYYEVGPSIHSCVSDPLLTRLSFMLISGPSPAHCCHSNTSQGDYAGVY